MLTPNMQGVIMAIGKARNVYDRCGPEAGFFKVQLTFSTLLLWLCVRYAFSLHSLPIKTVLAVILTLLWYISPLESRQLFPCWPAVHCLSAGSLSTFLCFSFLIIVAGIMKRRGEINKNMCSFPLLVAKPMPSLDYYFFFIQGHFHPGTISKRCSGFVHLKIFLINLNYFLLCNCVDVNTIY